MRPKGDIQEIEPGVFAVVVTRPDGTKGFYPISRQLKGEIDANERKQAARVSAELSLAQQRRREHEEPRPLSREIQARSANYGAQASGLSRVCEEKGFGVAAFEIEAIPEGLCESFTVSAF